VHSDFLKAEAESVPSTTTRFSGTRPWGPGRRKNNRRFHSVSSSRKLGDCGAAGSRTNDRGSMFGPAASCRWYGLRFAETNDRHAHVRQDAAVRRDLRCCGRITMTRPGKRHGTGFVHDPIPDPTLFRFFERGNGAVATGELHVGNMPLGIRGPLRERSNWTARSGRWPHGQVLARSDDCC